MHGLTQNLVYPINTCILTVQKNLWPNGCFLEHRTIHSDHHACTFTHVDATTIHIYCAYFPFNVRLRRFKQDILITLISTQTICMICIINIKHLKKVSEINFTTFNGSNLLRPTQGHTHRVSIDHTNNIFGKNAGQIRNIS